MNRRLPPAFSNERTSASAGSGKTRSLTNRYIALALRESKSDGSPNPECIAALTFTRKAAAEFLSNILLILSDALLSEENWGKLKSDIGELYGLTGGFQETEFLLSSRVFALLKECVLNSDKLKLSTIDSFLFTMASAFRSELGIFSPMEILDEWGAGSAREQTMERVLSEYSSAAAFPRFAELVKRVSFGKREKSFKSVLKTVTEKCGPAWSKYPNPDIWGDVSGMNASFENWDAKLHLEDTAELSSLVAKEGLEKIFEPLCEFFFKCSDFTFSKENTLYGRIAELFRNGELKGGAEFEYRRKRVEISEGVANVLNRILKRLLGANLKALSEATRALGEISSRYFELYDEMFVRRGKLTFDDFPKLLGNPNFSVARSLMEYRVDSKIRHWLFDEFQDTSVSQWKVFENLIDEIVEDGLSGAGDGRTFYYVGDVKQSLYSWRGGDSSLFENIPAMYSRKYGGRTAIFDGASLDVSWRSGKNVIRCVNSLFSDKNELAAAFDPKSAEEFSSSFNEHVSAEELGKKRFPPSYARLAVVDSIPDETFEVLKRENPLEKTCAVLVNDNKSANFYVDFLKEKFSSEKIGVSVEGDLETPLSRGNLVIPPFLATIRALSHPRDTASKIYATISPFAEFADGFSKSFKELASIKISSEGFEAFAKEYRKFALKKYPAFERYLDRLVSACSEFDSMGGGSLDSFAEWLGSKKFKIGGGAGRVQVMTVHKSKGLAFDAVVLPELHEISARAREGIFEVGGGLLLAPSSSVSMLSAELSKMRQENLSNERREAICRAYVACTRARNALHIIIPKLSKYVGAGEDSSYGEDNISMAQLIFDSFNPSLRAKGIGASERKKLFGKIETLGEFYIGDPLDFGRGKKEEPEELRKSPKKYRLPEKIKNPELSPRPKIADSPSKIFKSESSGSKKFGVAVHAWLSKENGGLPEKIEAEGVSEEVAEEARKKALEVLKSFKDIFREENERVMVFREFPFSGVFGGESISGAIDRLTVFRNSKGDAESAEIIDFKPRVDGKYSGQLLAYKKAVSLMFGIPERMVSARIAGYEDLRLSESF